MPSVPSPSQSPATGTTFGHTPAPKVTVLSAGAPAPRWWICQVPLRNTATSSTPLPSKSPATGKPRGSPKVKLAAGAGSAALVLLNLNTPPWKIPGVLTPSPSQSPERGTSAGGLVPKVNGSMVGLPLVRPRRSDQVVLAATTPGFDRGWTVMVKVCTADMAPPASSRRTE